MIILPGIGDVSRREADDYCTILSTLSALGRTEGELIKRILDVDGVGSDRFIEYMEKLRDKGYVATSGFGSEDGFEITREGEKLLERLSLEFIK